MNFIISFIFSLIIYLVLTIDSGNILYWSKEEIVLGIILSVITGMIMQKIFGLLKTNSVRNPGDGKKAQKGNVSNGIMVSPKFLNPLRWGLFLLYIFGPFLFSLIKANLEVAYRIVTGKIRPGIVKISSGLKTDFGMALLANSITLTPGTLSVEADRQNNLYVHWLYVKNKEPEIKEIVGDFAKWIKIITE